MKQLAIIGLNANPHDIPIGWDVWGLANGSVLTCDVFFEIHRNYLDHPGSYGGNDILTRLNDVHMPIMMAEKSDKVENSIAYPIDDIINEFGRYLECTVSYMLALAIHQRIQVIGLYGVSGDDGYASQRPNLEYLIGYARGRGIEVRIGPDSKLLTSAWPLGLYGIEAPQNGN